MDLSGLASSQAPNAVAGGLVLLLALVALARRDRLRWLYVILGVAFATVVVLKNLNYKHLVVGAEGNLDAHHRYADVMFWVVAIQVAIGVGLLVLALVSKKDLNWLSATAGLASGYAAVCMTGWHLAYLGPNANVRYEVWALPLHWVILGSLTIAIIMTVVSLFRGRGGQTATTP